MPLETPNRLVACGNILVDPQIDADPPTVADVYTFRSNNGLRDLAPNDPTTVASALGSGCNMQLDTPVTNDEGLVLAGGEMYLGLNPTTPAQNRVLGWITPAWTETGIAPIDTLPVHRVCLLIPGAALVAPDGLAAPARLSVCVFKVDRLPDLEQPAQPLPVPGVV
jgi:hypothetical protein